MLLCSYYPGVHRAEFDCSHFAPDIVKFACSKVKCPYFLFFLVITMIQVLLFFF